jgi:hypothetical protein
MTSTYIYILHREEADHRIVLALVPVFVDLAANVDDVALLEREFSAWEEEMSAKLACQASTDRAHLADCP